MYFHMPIAGIISTNFTFPTGIIHRHIDCRLISSSREAIRATIAHTSKGNRLLNNQANKHPGLPARNSFISTRSRSPFTFGLN